MGPMASSSPSATVPLGLEAFLSVAVRDETMGRRRASLHLHPKRGEPVMSNKGSEAENPEASTTDAARVPGMRRVVDRSNTHPTNVLTLLGREFIAMRGVFSPEFCPGSAVFAEMLSEKVPSGSRFLEIGPGIGLVSVLVAVGGASVTAVDVNPAAVVNTKINALLHDVALAVDVVEGDLFEPLAPQTRFDVIYWNAPWGNIPAAEVESALELSVFDPGYRALRRFVGQVTNWLAPKGVAFIGFSDTFGDSTIVQRLADANGLSVTVDQERTVWDEPFPDGTGEALETRYQLHALTRSDGGRGHDL